MKFLERHSMLVLVIGLLGVSASAILVKYATAPSVVTAAYRLGWTVLLMTPAVFGNRAHRAELFSSSKKLMGLCAAAGIFLALHFVSWFESLSMTSVASSTAIVCTEVIWVSLGFCVFLKGKLARPALLSIAVTLAGSMIIAFSDSSAGGDNIFGDLVALISAMLVAAYTLIGRVARANSSATVYSYLVYCFCFAALILASAVSGTPLWGYEPVNQAVGFFLALLSTILGHNIFNWCLRYMSPSFVSASKLCEPIIAAFFAWLLFSEVPAVLQVIGGAVIIAGVISYSRVEGASASK